MAKSKLTRIEAFWKFVDKNGPVHSILGTPCWLWTGGLNTPGGYPRFWNGVNYELGHRWAYRTFVGPIPDGQRVLHACDRPNCVNYELHLFLGTQTINIADMENKGRAHHPRGEDSGRAKLTDEQVREIRAALANSMLQPVMRGGLAMTYPRTYAARGTVRLLATRFSVSRRTIWLVGRGVTYS